MKISRVMIALIVLACPALAQAETGVLTWSPSVSPGVTNYNVYRFLGSCTTLGPPSFLTKLGNVSTWTDTTIPSGSLGARYELTALIGTLESLVRSASACKSFQGTVPSPLTVSISIPAGTTFTANQDGSAILTALNVTTSRAVVKVELSRDAFAPFQAWTALPYTLQWCVTCFTATEPLPRSTVLQATATAADGTVATATVTVQVNPYVPPITPPQAPTNLTVTQLTADTIQITARPVVCKSIKTTGTGLTRKVSCIH